LLSAILNITYSYSVCQEGNQATGGSATEKCSHPDTGIGSSVMTSSYFSLRKRTYPLSPNKNIVELYLLTLIFLLRGEPSVPTPSIRGTNKLIHRERVVMTRIYETAMGT
jgi:hypothetical protein